MAQDNQIIAEIIVEGADQFKAQLQSSRKEVQAFDDDQKELNNTLAEAKNKLKDLETQGKANTAEYKKLENETRAVEISMQSQGKATDSLRTQQRKLKEEYADLRIKMEQLEKANLKGTDSYKLLEQRMQVVQQEAGSLNDLMGDVSSEISQLGSDTQGIDKTLRGVTALAGGFSAVQGVMALFGSENEAIEKTLLKVNAAMAIASGTQQLFTELRAKDSIFIAIQGKAQKLLNLVIGQGTIVTKLFRGALTAIGIGLVITLISALVANFDKFKKVLFNIFPPLKNLGKYFKEIKQNVIDFLKNGILMLLNGFVDLYNSSLLVRQVISGIGSTVKGVVNIIINQFKNIGTIVGAVFEAIKSGGKNIKEIFGDAFKEIGQRNKETAVKIVDDYKNGFKNAKDAKLKALTLDDLDFKGEEKGKEEGDNFSKGFTQEAKTGLELLKDKLSKEQKNLEKLISDLVIKGKPTETPAVIKIRTNITDLENQIKEIETKLSNQPLKAMVDIDIKTGEDFEQNLKRSIDEAKAKFRDLFNIIYESGGDVTTDPELKQQAEKIKILEQQLEEALKLYDDYFKEAEQKATYSNEQIFTIEQEKTKLLRNEYLTRLDELRNFYNEGLISEQEYNEAVKDLGEQRNATLQENIGKATEIYGYLNQVATEVSQLATDIIQQNAEKELATLDDKKKRGVISEKQYEKEVAKVKNEQARKQKAVETAQAFLKVPQVILNTLAQVPFPANIVLAPILGALALAQAIRVAKAPLPKFRDGGFADRIFKGSGKVVGKSHAQGGVNAELEGNEYVMQGKAVSFYGQDFMKAVNNMNYQPPTLKTKDIYYPKEDKLSNKLDLIASYTKQSYKTVEKSNQLLSSINQNTKTGKNARV